MRLPINSWTNTLTKLGFRKARRKKRPNQSLRGQRLAFESLEERQLLAADTLAVAQQKLELHAFVEDVVDTYTTDGLLVLESDYLQGLPVHTVDEYRAFGDALASGYSDAQWQQFGEAFVNGRYSPLDDLLVFALSTASQQAEQLPNVSNDPLGTM